MSSTASRPLCSPANGWLPDRYTTQSLVSSCRTAAVSPANIACMILRTARMFGCSAIENPTFRRCVLTPESSLTEPDVHHSTVSVFCRILTTAALLRNDTSSAYDPPGSRHRLSSRRTTRTSGSSELRRSGWKSSGAKNTSTSAGQDSCSATISPPRRRTQTQPFASSAGHSRTGNGRSTQICSAPDTLATSLYWPATSSDTCRDGTSGSNIQYDATPDSSYTLRLTVASYRLVLGDSTSMTSSGATTRFLSGATDRWMTPRSGWSDRCWFGWESNGATKTCMSSGQALRRADTNPNTDA